MEGFLSSVDQLQQTDQGRREFAKEELAFAAAELISELMESQNISKVELAKKIERSKSHVTQILSGSRNMTMHTLAELAFMLGHTVKVRAEPISKPKMISISREAMRRDLHKSGQVVSQDPTYNIAA